MVLAILNGTKTQTRRVVKPQPVEPRFDGPCRFTSIRIGRDGNEREGPEVFGIHGRDGEWGIRCPYGRPGDRLWVRESFAENLVLPLAHRQPGEWIYAADLNEQGGQRYAAKWTPSIHMPRLASRLTLEIVGVRAERLNAISHLDAVAEGCTGLYPRGGQRPTSPRFQFSSLWCRINGHESWLANPWVWVIEFTKI